MKRTVVPLVGLVLTLLLTLAPHANAESGAHRGLTQAFPGSKASQGIRPLGKAEATRYANRVLRREFGGSWIHGSGKKLGCAYKVVNRYMRKCFVRWAIGDISAKGIVQIRVNARYFFYSYSVRVTNHYCLATGGSNCTRTERGHS
jgi:hypothetical protein